MLDPQASRFWQAALLSGLVDAEGLGACWNAIPTGKREAPEHIDRRLARQAVQSRALTLWQAQQLLAGRTSGYKVGRYVLLDLIGQGGMGRVYLARDTKLNRRVALKILSPERVNNPRAIARFQREARVGAQLEHENLVRIYDFDESNGRYFLVMEYIEGKTIGTLISEQGALPVATTARLIRQVALGLAYAHRKGLIHRDVNPYNILVTHDGTAKLADLGLAIDPSDEERVTREGATVGTFDYVAPEQARHSHSADIRSDIYSLGCTFYHTSTGQVPFPNPSLPEKLFGHQALEPTPIEQLVSGIPEPLCEIVRRMMRKSPDDRYATPLEVAQALEPYVDEQAGVMEGDHSLASKTDTAVPRLPGGMANPAEVIPGVIDAIRALAKTVGEAGDATSQPSGTGEPVVQPSVPNPALYPSSPDADAHSSNPEYPLSLDFGAAPSLSEGLARPKSRSRPDPPTGLVVRLLTDAWLNRARLRRAWFTHHRLKRAWRWGLVVVSVTVTIMAVLLAVANPFGKAWMAPATDRIPKVRHPAFHQMAESAIVVRKEGEDDVAFDSSRLLQAMQTAMGKEGWVELRNRSPLHISSDQGGDLASGQGRLVIRAATGLQPVIEVEMKGNRPFLSAGSAVPLELSGLTFVAFYPQFEHPPPSTSALPPVAVAAASAKVERCAFKVAGTARARGSRAFVSNGGMLTIDRCWFQGFDEAVEIAAMGKTRAHIEQTVIFPAVNSITAQAPEWYGWAIRLNGGQAIQTKTTSPQLVVEHCTVEGAGLLDLTDSSSPSGLRVEIKHCAIRAEAVVACKGGKLPNSQLAWRGEGNQYDIHGPSWIVLQSREGTPAFSAETTDLDGWTRLFTEDTKPIRAKLKFRTDPTVRSGVIQPYDFAIEGSGLSQTRPGADPDLVGPWSDH
jgi:eukaryotic-like serine/threonine-protein kinase